MGCIARIRVKELKISQKELAQKAKINQSLVSKVERGQRRVPLRLAQAIEKLSLGKYEWSMWFNEGIGIYSEPYGDQRSRPRVNS